MIGMIASTLLVLVVCAELVLLGRAVPAAAPALPAGASRLERDLTAGVALLRAASTAYAERIERYLTEMSGTPAGRATPGTR
ncbi:hypothetical protein SAMN05421810_10863 [Amycolatopsis arida]|uniref:Uncharacterized protein n=1 Tax=Amycolatopsis arida TaxID=587909 RepID=A0A1I5YYV4_9PSEU|nr:hypothetical protein [Amycolatopsis arida]TDX89976.1 hypothetical protein CLV69_10863 [Amycolatopsis arida]SFQ49235.1 hypothetical protein SAMN05421810_10863 [Amycolatopsis arida]